MRDNGAGRGGAPPLEGRAEAVGRIAASRRFARASRLRVLLSFVMERCLAGRSDELTEGLIAAEVFGRSGAFDPASDNIVRVSMRQVRMKLKEYYLEEGRDEPWVVDIPKGGYVPTVHPRVETNGPPALVAVASRWGGEGGLRSALLAASAVFLALTVLLWRENLRLKAGPGTRPAEVSLLSEAVVRSGQKTIVVPADSGLSLMELLAERRIGLPQYTHERPWPVPQLLESQMGRRLWEHLEIRQLTHASLFTLIQRMVRQNPNADITIRHPRTLSSRDFKSENFVLLGMTNPWLSLFEPKLNFVLGEGYPARPGVIRNLAPRQGEPAEYRDVAVLAQSGPSYARVAFLPNLNRSGTVALITGRGAYRTEAAAKFILRADSGRLIRSTLGLPAGVPLPTFEMVLETEEIDRTGTSARVLAWRLHQ